VASALVASLTALSVQATEPWVDPDPAEPPERYAIGDFGIAAEAEYRAQYTLVNPVSLNTENNRRFAVIDHRGRFGGTFDYDEAVKISLSLDLLDGVLWGDNGTFAGDPSSESGLQVTTRDPNVTEPCMRYLGVGDELQPESYGFGLCDAPPLKVRRLYGQVNTPIGAFRVGRQPVNIGMSVQTSDGEGRQNRWGVAHDGDFVDRVLFATKPLEAFKPPELRNTSENEGFIVALIYDRWVTDTPRQFSDDVNQIAVGLRFLQADFGFGRDLESTAFYAHRWDAQYETRVHTVGAKVAARFEGFHVGLEGVTNLGSTREVAASYALITNDPVVDQELLQFGGRLVARYDWPVATAYFELDYASGDGDPNPRTRLSQFTWSEDTNVGLLLFEHVLHFQSARSAAAGVEILRRLGAETFAGERVNTRGAFTNALAIFPQVDLRPHEQILFRFGVLVAYGPEVVNDQVQSLQGRDGNTIEDDLVNFAGGKASNFYGVELDGRFRWRFLDHFAFDLEGAVLFPGEALEDENGDAVHSFLTQARTSFFF
jgi:hypothetical protein